MVLQISPGLVTPVTTSAELRINMKTLVWLAVILLSAVVCEAAEVCRCGDPANQTPRQKREAWLSVVDKTTAIFTGEVLGTEDGKATLKVDRIWKGELVDEVVLKISVAEGDSGDTTCDFPYNLGDKYLIYAWSQNEELVTHLCSRSANIKHAEGIEEEIEGLNESKQPEVRNKEPK